MAHSHTGISYESNNLSQKKGIQKIKTEQKKKLEKKFKYIIGFNSSRLDTAEVISEL